MRGAGGILKRYLVRTTAALVGGMSVWLLTASPAEASWTPAGNVTLLGWMGADAPMVAADRQGD